MKLHQLDALVGVLEYGGIRAAARQLHLSQAALTKSLRLLEQEVGMPLLVRRSRGIDFTKAGERLLARAKLIKRQIELASEELRQTEGDDHGTIHVGLTPYLTLTALGEAFGWFRSRYQNVSVRLVEGLVARALPQLRDGSLDLAVLAIDVDEFPNKEFGTTHIHNVPQLIVAREGHPILADPNAKALSRLEWALSRPITEGPFRGQAAMFALAGVAPPCRVVVCESLAAMALVRNSDVISIFPAPLLAQPESRGIVAVPSKQLCPSNAELMIVTRPEVPLTPAAAYFAWCVSEVVKCDTCLT